MLENKNGQEPSGAEQQSPEHSETTKGRVRKTLSKVAGKAKRAVAVVAAAGVIGGVGAGIGYLVGQNDGFAAGKAFEKRRVHYAELFETVSASALGTDAENRTPEEQKAHEAAINTAAELMALATKDPRMQLLLDTTISMRWDAVVAQNPDLNLPKLPEQPLPPLDKLVK